MKTKKEPKTFYICIYSIKSNGESEIALTFVRTTQKLIEK